MVSASGVLAAESLPVNMVWGAQITPTTTLPTWSIFDIGKIADKNTSDLSPYNGFASSATAGTIKLQLDRDYTLNSFMLWNDINVQAEGVAEFTLEFFNAAGTLISRSAVMQPVINTLAASTFNFPEIANVRRVDLVITKSFNRIEMRELGFVGLPTSLVWGAQITPTTTLPTWSTFDIGKIADKNTSDLSPYNGFASSASTGTIKLQLDRDYTLNGFMLWNDINVQAEGVAEFTLEFFNATGTLISRSGVMQTTIETLSPSIFNFPEVPDVRRVDLVITKSFSRIEVRELGVLAAPTNLIWGAQITPTTTLPTWSSFGIGKIADQNTSDVSPYNGFASTATAGTIKLQLDKDYHLSGFMLWNDINVQAEGVAEFTLEFFNAADTLISRSGVMQTTIETLPASTFTFPAVANVRRVDMVITKSFNRIEIRELGLLGVEGNPIAGNAIYIAKCQKCHGTDGVAGGAGGARVNLNPANYPLTSLITKITTTMPRDNLGTCNAQCAADIAQYLQTWIVVPAACGQTEVALPQQVRLLTAKEYENTVNDLFGIDSKVAANLPTSGMVAGYDNNAKASAVSETHMSKYWDTAGLLADIVSLAGINTCNLRTVACAGTIIDALGPKILRRPLTTPERWDYIDLFMYSTDSVQGTRFLIRAMLMSPDFLYRSEVGVNGTLTPYETASLLSYTFWGSMPDAALFTAAAMNQLGTTAQLRAQVTRLLADPRAKKQLIYFAREWLGARPMLDISKDSNVYPGFTSGVRTALDTEFDLFFQDLFFNGTSKFSDLLLADYTFANNVLAQFYGLAGGTATFAKMPTGLQRGGILDLGAVLASHAQSAQTSPIRRGIFVRERLLCQELPPPPTGMSLPPVAFDPTKPTRERFAAHTSEPLCQGCHQYIDPIGFSFERYDGIGAYRTVENGVWVDDSGALSGIVNRTDPDTVNYFGTQQLAGIIAGATSARACFAQQFETYLGGAKEPDRCVVQNLASRWGAKAYTINDLWLESVSSASFLKRN